MEFQRYKVEDKDLALLNKLYIFLNYKPFAYGYVELNITTDYAIKKINEIIGYKLYELKWLRNTCFSDNQIRFMDAAEKAGYDVQFKLNSYGAFDPYIVSTTADERMKSFYFSSDENEDDVVFRFEKREPQYPMRGMHNGRWVDYFYFIAVQ